MYRFTTPDSKVIEAKNFETDTEHDGKSFVTLMNEAGYHLMLDKKYSEDGKLLSVILNFQGVAVDMNPTNLTDAYGPAMKMAVEEIKRASDAHFSYDCSIK